MARDPLAVVWRVRDAAVREASAALAEANHFLRQREQLLHAHAAQLAHEHAAATDADTTAFAIWLPHARARAVELQAAVAGAQDRATNCQRTLVARRMEAEVISKLMQRRAAEAALLAARRGQAEMEEIAARPRTGFFAA